MTLERYGVVIHGNYFLNYFRCRQVEADTIIEQQRESRVKVGKGKQLLRKRIHYGDDQSCKGEYVFSFIDACAIEHMVLC